MTPHRHIPVTSLEQYGVLLSRAFMPNGLKGPHPQRLLLVVCQHCGMRRTRRSFGDQMFWIGEVFAGEPYPLFVSRDRNVTRGDHVGGVLLGHPFRHPTVRCLVRCPTHGAAELTPEFLLRRLARAEATAAPVDWNSTVAKERILRVRCSNVEFDSV